MAPRRSTAAAGAAVTAREALWYHGAALLQQERQLLRGKPCITRAAHEAASLSAARHTTVHKLSEHFYHQNSNTIFDETNFTFLCKPVKYYYHILNGNLM